MYFRVTVKILTTNVVVDLNSKTINIIKKKMLHCSKLTAQMNLFLLDAFWFEFPFRFCFTNHWIDFSASGHFVREGIIRPIENCMNLQR